MGNIKQINMKNRTYYFFNDMIKIKNFDSNLFIPCTLLMIKQMVTLKKQWK